MACFFIILSSKGFQCCVTNYKIEFEQIKFSRIFRPSKASTLRYLRRSKNPTKEVRLRYVGRQAGKDQTPVYFYFPAHKVLAHTYFLLNENSHNQGVNSHET